MENDDLKTVLKDKNIEFVQNNYSAIHQMRSLRDRDFETEKQNTKRDLRLNSIFLQGNKAKEETKKVVKI